MQIADHLDDEATLAVEYLIGTIELADRGHQILYGQSALFHAEADRLDGVGRFDGVLGGLVGLDQYGKAFETAAVRAAGSGSFSK